MTPNLSPRLSRPPSRTVHTACGRAQRAQAAAQRRRWRRRAPAAPGPRVAAPCPPAPAPPARHPPARRVSTGHVHRSGAAGGAHLGQQRRRGGRAGRDPARAARRQRGSLPRQRAARTHVASVVMSPIPAESSSSAAAMTCASDAGAASQTAQRTGARVPRRTALMLYVGCCGGGMGAAMRGNTRPRGRNAFGLKTLLSNQRFCLSIFRRAPIYMRLARQSNRLSGGGSLSESSSGAAAAAAAAVAAAGCCAAACCCRSAACRSSAACRLSSSTRVRHSLRSTALVSERSCSSPAAGCDALLLKLQAVLLLIRLGRLRGGGRSAARNGAQAQRSAALACSSSCRASSCSTSAPMAC